MHKTLEELCKQAHEARIRVGNLDTDLKNDTLKLAADTLMAHEKEILAANAKDLEKGRANGLTESILDRLALNHERLLGMADGIIKVAKLDDPIGEVLSMKNMKNGLIIGKKRVPIGVIGMIYEARPNVTSDAFALCFKSGNCVILKGGSDAIQSNIAIVDALNEALNQMEMPQGTLSLIESTDRETTNAFMRMNDYVDVLIPRGGAGLIKNVVNNSTVPVIETGTGNCHVYVDSLADLDMAANIIVNAKTQRVSVCNACESIVIHQSVLRAFMPMLYDALAPFNVEMRCDKEALSCLTGEHPLAVPATEEDWGTEYLDYIVSVKTVGSVDEAIEHINRYNTSHSETIVTKDYDICQKFLDEVDSACVYVNASTRFSDGDEFGFGAEIGISTQKLHARGPMGLEALTSYKYTIYGNGQVRT
jgi:glutamate-5-semialdehyde dehydrogenase